ncbi:MAG: DegT/DnrJ/EryC1/StrS family aminotransferase [Candidatus Paracaedibacter sp.]
MPSRIYCSYPPAQFQSYKQEIMEAVHKVFEKGPYILGAEVEAFEQEFSNFHNLKYAVGVGSGTDALALTLKAYRIGAGDEVITVSHTALATAAAIVIAGATPVLVDIEENYFTMDPKTIEAAITPQTKAIIPVHLYGQPCDMDAIMAIADKHHLIVIEDCAQAHGATYKGKIVGSIGHAGCFSFYPTKNLSAIGDGGGVITDDHQICERLKRLRQYGWDEDRVSQEPGVVSRLDEIQAAILRIKLKYLNEDNQKRRLIAKNYTTLLKSTKLTYPEVRPDCEHVFHLYVIQTKSQGNLKKSLAEYGIEAGIHYTHPIHMHPGYLNKIKISPAGLSVTNKIIQEILTLPVYPELTVSSICPKILEAVA